MNMKKICLFAAAASCLLVFGLSAAENKAAAEPSASDAEKNEPAVKTTKPILIRHGAIYSAEISKKKPEFQLEDRGDQPVFPNPAWAAVILKLPRNRGISRFDYELKTNSGSYPCLAVALGSEPYSQKRDRWTLEAQKELEGKFVRMLFAFPSADLTDGASMQTLDLEFKIRDTKCQPPPIPFRILPDDQPLNSDPQTLGKNGNCGLTWLELHPEAQPSLDDKPADSAEKQAE